MDIPFLFDKIYYVQRNKKDKSVAVGSFIFKLMDLSVGHWPL